MGLLPGTPLTPRLVERAVRLGTSLPFAEAAALLAEFTGVRIGAETVRRLTEAAGAAQLAGEAAALAELERTLPTPPVGPAVQLLSVDGAMVPLRDGVWAEVKTLAVGTVVADGDEVRTTDLSYGARLTDATTFGQVATVETQRRGTTTAGRVVAVTDGAVWCQGFVDLHRPDALRILDFPHAVEHLGTAAQALFGTGTAAASEWLGVQAHRLRHGQEDAVLAVLTDGAAMPGLSAVARATVTSVQGYLATRQTQIRYQAFAAAGNPIGSGGVESANKLVVEARLKGAGMHWARGNVNPLLALRVLLANDRWTAAWPALWRQWRATIRARPPDSLPVAPDPPLAATLPPAEAAPRAAATPRPRVKTLVNGKPTAAHPWKTFVAQDAKA